MGNSPSTMRYHYASSISVGGREAAGAMDKILNDGKLANASRRHRRLSSGASGDAAAPGEEGETA